MNTFDFTTTLIPLTCLILLGWLVGRARDIDLASVSAILVYAVSPVVAFGSTAQMHFQGSLVFLPVISYLISTLCGLAAFTLGKHLLEKKELRYLLPMTAGSGNNGYFGLPLAMAVFAPEQVGVYFLVTMGVSLFEATIGYYFVARGRLSVRDALKRVVRVPVFYAIAGGLAFSALDIKLDASLLKLWDVARGGYVCLGMMIIGMALAKHKKLAWDKDFLALSMFGKYGLWALFVSGFIWADTHVFKTYGTDIHQMLLILVITPVAANVAAFAADNDFKPQHAATIVFLTTILSFAFLPLTLPWVMSWK